MVRDNWRSFYFFFFLSFLKKQCPKHCESAQNATTTHPVGKIAAPKQPPNQHFPFFISQISQKEVDYIYMLVGYSLATFNLIKPLYI